MTGTVQLSACDSLAPVVVLVEVAAQASAEALLLAEGGLGNLGRGASLDVVVA